MEHQLVAGRECGPCNVCCVALTIHDPALEKPQGYRCPNTLPNKGCAIYDTRPGTCRTFHCGWRHLRWVRDTLRPDLSGVLIRFLNAVAADGTTQPGIIVTLLERSALKAPGLAESVAAAVSAGVPVYLEVPGPPGYTSGRARINEALGDAIYTRDKEAVLQVLRRAYAMGRAGEHKPLSAARRQSPPPGGFAGRE